MSIIQQTYEPCKEYPVWPYLRGNCGCRTRPANILTLIPSMQWFSFCKEHLLFSLNKTSSLSWSFSNLTSMLPSTVWLLFACYVFTEFLESWGTFLIKFESVSTWVLWIFSLVLFTWDVSHRRAFDLTSVATEGPAVLFSFLSVRSLS